MVISSRLEEYIGQSIQVSKSNIIITDLENVKFAKTIDRNANYSIDNYSLDIKSKHLINNSNFSNPNSYLLLNNDECIRILENDPINYACQMIFPLCDSKNHMQGLLILYRLSRQLYQEQFKICRKF